MRTVINIPFLGNIPSYLFFATIGLFIVSMEALYHAYKKGYDVRKFNKNHIISLVGLFIGMKVFGMLSIFLDMLWKKQEIDFEKILNSGIVFYGGIIGYYIIARILERKKENQYIFDILAFCYPLFGIFGRIGCFFAGCCYGIESNSWLAIEYPEGISNEVVRRIPVQLWESCANIIIFMIIIFLYRRNKLKGKLIYIYFIMYGSIRFILEYFRGDIIRGVYGIFSFSQIISIIVIIYSILNLVKKYKKGE